MTIITERVLIIALMAIITVLTCMMSAMALDTQSARQFQRGYDVGYRQAVIDEEGGK